MFHENFSVKPNLSIDIYRILIDEDTFKDSNLISIGHSAYFDAYERHKDPFVLPKLYAALKHLTGPGDLMYDDWKGSFSFSFILEVNKDDHISKYFYHLYHFRSYIECALSQLVSKKDQHDSNVMHKPNDTLFSNSDICHFNAYFCNFLIGFLKGSQHLPSPFVKYSDSNHLLFGYLKKKYFLKEYDDEDVYRNKKENLSSLIERNYKFLISSEEEHA